MHEMKGLPEKSTPVDEHSRESRPQDQRNLYLVGPMGAGKTTIGRRLARHLGMPFFDLDSELEKRTGADVSLIFDVEGEPGFRRRESGLLKELAARNGALIATGGGSVLEAENRRVMRHSGHVIFLKASVDQQLQRLERDKQRPLLQTPDRRQRLNALARARDPIYEELADLVVQSDGRSVPAMARWICRRLKQELGIEKPEHRHEDA